MTYAIITDSSSDLPIEIRREFNLRVLSLTVVTADGTEIKDCDIQPKEIFDRMRAGEIFKTSQVSAGEFYDVFEEYAKEGTPLIYLAFSSGLSGTYNSACTARDQILEKYPDFDISIVDTKCASTGMGLVVYKALCMQRDGASKDDVIAAAEQNSYNLEHIFTVDDLKYLHRGGRVSKTAAIIGGVLGIKPILHVDDEGKLIPIEKVRGRKTSIKRLAEIAGIRGYDLDKQIIGICHGDCIDDAEELKRHMSEMYGCSDFIISYTGSTIGCHSGPGTLALFFLSK